MYLVNTRNWWSIFRPYKHIWNNAALKLHQQWHISCLCRMKLLATVHTSWPTGMPSCIYIQRYNSCLHAKPWTCYCSMLCVTTVRTAWRVHCVVLTYCKALVSQWNACGLHDTVFISSWVRVVTSSGTCVNVKLQLDGTVPDLCSKIG